MTSRSFKILSYFNFYPGKKGRQSALDLKKRILRHCILSYTLLFITISPTLKKKYSSGEDLVIKGLASWDGAIARLKKDQGSNLGWMDKWWVPINWCCHLIRHESGPDLHVPRESKEIINK